MEVLAKYRRFNGKFMVG